MTSKFLPTSVRIFVVFRKLPPVLRRYPGGNIHVIELFLEDIWVCNGQQQLLLFLSIDGNDRKCSRGKDELLSISKLNI